MVQSRRTAPVGEEEWLCLPIGHLVPEMQIRLLDAEWELAKGKVKAGLGPGPLHKA